MLVPKLSPQARWGYYKICRKAGEFPDAIGAVVKVRVGNQTITRQVMPTRGYLSPHALSAAWGLAFQR